VSTSSSSGCGLASVGDEIRTTLGKAEHAVDRAFASSDSTRIDYLRDLLERAAASS
jgi:hypothetical protein